MDAYAFVFPILPGRAEAGRAFAKEITGREMRASREPIGVTRETVWLHSTPMGDFGIVLLEGEDVAEANRRFAASTDPFDVWFKETMLDISGVDFGQPIPAMSEVLIDYRG
ncbi:MAG: hypothetical protein ACT4PO_15630 [Actinomycetota bacterium]